MSISLYNYLYYAFYGMYSHMAMPIVESLNYLIFTVTILDELPADGTKKIPRSMTEGFEERDRPQP